MSGPSVSSRVNALLMHSAMGEETRKWRWAMLPATPLAKEKQKEMERAKAWVSALESVAAE